MSSVIDNLQSFSLLDLFRIEAENQAATLDKGLLRLEQHPTDAALIEPLMRAAHSIKGAARIVDLPDIVRLAHVMEDCLVEAQNARLILTADHLDLLFKCTDLIRQLGQLSGPEIAVWIDEQQSSILELATALGAARVPGKESTAEKSLIEQKSSPSPELDKPYSPADPGALCSTPTHSASVNDRVLRLSAERLDQLMGLAGEILVGNHQIKSLSDALLGIKREQVALAQRLDRVQDNLGAATQGTASHYLREARQLLAAIHERLTQQLVNLDQYERASGNLSQRLYRSVISSRMRPFADLGNSLQRTVRDLARTLDKPVRLEIKGPDTQVDRDILERLGAPLNHLLRNAIDHGIEPLETRRTLNKPEEGLIHIEARHQGGMLQIVIGDDGRGIDTEALRGRIVAQGLASTDMAAVMSETELFDFLFLPNFSLAPRVTEISGRGVGLDAVLTAVQELRGMVKVHSEAGRGAQFQLSLPLTLSVLKGLLVEIGAEPYVLPLSRIDRVLEISREDLKSLEGRNFFTLDGQHIGLIAAHQVLELDPPELRPTLQVVVLSDRLNRIGIVVDAFKGEGQFVVQALDPRLGKIRDIESATVLDDGSPALIIDVDDLVRSMDKLINSGRLGRMTMGKPSESGARVRTILVVDDSFTVREVERKLLEGQGYRVELAVDGMDGWNAVRLGNYDLVITDVDMPRMNGIELVSLIKNDPLRKDMPVMIVSYKDREEDQLRGLEAGADYYLTKGSFHDETLLEAVRDLIGEP